MSRPASSPLRGTLAPALLVALALGGCNNPLPSVSDPIASRPPPPQSDQVALRAYAEQLEPKYAQNADDRVTALHYAQALRGLGQHAQAVAVLQGLAVKNPHDMPVLAAYGKALADAGRLQEAQSVLERAHTPDRPSWSVLSAQGSVADQMGDHAGAQHYYSAALKIVPNQPDVLSNLGLSYALERKMPQAEQALRLAADQPSADSRVRQNLALVLSLEGKYADAEQVSRRDMTPIDAAENVAQLKQTIAGSPTWSQAEAARPGPRRIVRQTADAPVRTASSDSDQ
jgi:Flp pilus assembly protein TadD